MEIKLNVKTVLTLDAEERRILSKALRMALTTDEEKAAALELQEKMFRGTAANLQQLLEQNEQHIKNIMEKKPG